MEQQHLSYEETLKLNLEFVKWVQAHGYKRMKLAEITGYSNALGFYKGHVKHIPKIEADKITEVMNYDKSPIQAS